MLAHESINFDPDVISGKRNSPAGAIGIAQFMPETAKSMGVDPLDIKSAIEGAARYLKQNFDKFGSWDLALAAYNAGEGNVTKYGGIPPFAETQNYVKDILYNRVAQAKGNTSVGGFGNAIERFMATITPTTYAAEKPSSLPKSSELMSGSQYTVKKGDTLWDIANKYLGNGQRWKELVGYSGDPTKMPIGTKLTVPAIQGIQSSVQSPPKVESTPNQVDKYFSPNTMGGYQLPSNAQALPQPTQKFTPFKGVVPIPTPAYISSQSNPIQKYFQPNTVGGYQAPSVPIKSNTNILQDATNWWKKNIWGVK